MEWPPQRYVTASIRVGPSPARARATAVFVASYTASASLPSTRTPGIAYAAARPAIDSPAMVRLEEVDSAYWLFSHMKMMGSFQTAARLSDSWTTPWLEAPSPKNATTTRSVFRMRLASAAPAPMGSPAAT